MDIRQEWVSKTAPMKRWEEDCDYDGALAKLARFGVAPDSREAYAVSRLVRRRVTRESVDTMISDLAHFLGWVRKNGRKPLEIDEQDAEDYVNELRRQGYHKGTTYKRANVAKLLLEEACRKDWRRRNPFRYVNIKSGPPTNRTPALTKEDVENCLTAIRAEFTHPERGLTARRDFALISLYAWTAVRSVEVCRMRWRDFFLDREQVMVRIHGKGGKTADVGVPLVVVDALNEWRSTWERCRNFTLRPIDPVFPSVAPRFTNTVRVIKDDQELPGLQSQSFSMIVQARLADVGVTGRRVRAHSLRATAATVAIANGASMPQVQRFLRHASMDTTQGYIDWVQALKNDAQSHLDYAMPATADQSSPLEDEAVELDVGDAQHL